MDWCIRSKDRVCPIQLDLWFYVQHIGLVPGNWTNLAVDSADVERCEWKRTSFQKWWTEIVSNNPNKEVSKRWSYSLTSGQSKPIKAWDRDNWAVLLEPSISSNFVTDRLIRIAQRTVLSNPIRQRKSNHQTAWRDLAPGYRHQLGCKHWSCHASSLPHQHYDPCLRKRNGNDGRRLIRLACDSGTNGRENRSFDLGSPADGGCWHLRICNLAVEQATRFQIMTLGPTFVLWKVTSWDWIIPTKRRRVSSLFISKE